MSAATDRPQVVAHRGASFATAEHTLEAYVEAIEAGADALECDVRLTADGHLVCVHDRSLRRTASSRGLVSTMQLAQLDELDFASWKNPWADLDDEAPALADDRGRVLTLRRLLETVAALDRRVEVAIETKHPTRFGGLVERRLAEMLRDFGWHVPGAPVRVMSFSYTALQRMERLTPDVQMVMLVDRANTWPMLRRVIGRDWLVGPGVEVLREHPKLARKIHKRGHDIHVWVANDEADLEVCRRADARAIITDRPAFVLAALTDATDAPASRVGR